MTSFTFYLMPLALPRSLLLFLIIYINSRMERLRVAVGSTSNKENKEEKKMRPFVFNLFNKKIMDHSTTAPSAFLVSWMEIKALSSFISFRLHFLIRTRVEMPLILHLVL